MDKLEQVKDVASDAIKAGDKLSEVAFGAKKVEKRKIKAIKHYHKHFAEAVAKSKPFKEIADKEAEAELSPRTSGVKVAIQPEESLQVSPKTPARITAR